MKDTNFYYKSSLNTPNFLQFSQFVENLIKKDNTSEFQYLSLSIRNHKINFATSIPSNTEVIKDYVKYGLIEIDPLACFERFTSKKIVTFSDIKRYKNNGKCGKSYMTIRRKSGLRHGFHYIHRNEDWSFTVVFGSDYKKNGFAVDEDLISKNATWLNSTIQNSLLFLDENKNILVNRKLHLVTSHH